MSLEPLLLLDQTSKNPSTSRSISTSVCVSVRVYCTQGERRRSTYIKPHGTLITNGIQKVAAEKGMISSHSPYCTRLPFSILYASMHVDKEENNSFRKKICVSSRKRHLKFSSRRSVNHSSPFGPILWMKQRKYWIILPPERIEEGFRLKSLEFYNKQDENPAKLYAKHVCTQAEAKWIPCKKK